MAVAQSDLNTLQTTVNADGTLSNAQKAQTQGLLYAVSRVLFGNASNPPSNGAQG
jgi:hypothetical protein